MVTTTDYKFPKEYFKYINRFLKEVGLYPQWIRFLYFNSNGQSINGFGKRHTNWLEPRRNYSLVNVLGKTNFSDFLKLCCNKQLPNGLCTYELFAAFLQAFYPEMLKEYDDIEAAEMGEDYVIIDKEKKKVEINWDDEVF